MLNDILGDFGGNDLFGLGFLAFKLGDTDDGHLVLQVGNVSSLTGIASAINRLG